MGRSKGISISLAHRWVLHTRRWDTHGCQCHATHPKHPFLGSLLCSGAGRGAPGPPQPPCAPPALLKQRVPLGGEGLRLVCWECCWKPSGKQFRESKGKGKVCRDSSGVVSYSRERSLWVDQVRRGTAMGHAAHGASLVPAATGRSSAQAHADARLRKEVWGAHGS